MMSNDVDGRRHVGDLIDATIVLAAGLGTRMGGGVPKPMVKICGGTLLDLSTRCVDGVPKKILVVSQLMVEQHGPDLEGRVGDDTKMVVQEERRGTGDAVRVGMGLLAENDDIVAVTYADTPFVSSQTMKNAATLVKSGLADLVVVAFKSSAPNAYGKIERVEGAAGEAFLAQLPKGFRAEFEASLVLRIDEVGGQEVCEAGAVGDDRWCNSGVMVVKKSLLDKGVPQIKPRGSKGEFQLTELLEICSANGGRCACVLAHEDEAMGVNSPAELMRATEVLQRHLRMKHLAAGVQMVDPNSVYFSWDTVVGEGTRIMPCVNFGSGAKVGAGCTIGAFSSLADCVLEDGCTVGPNVFVDEGVRIQTGAKVYESSSLRGCVIGAGSCVGPFARIRPKTVIGEGVRIGNFVEIKESEIGSGTKISHLSYVGNATLGKEVLMGAGSITCNYDGFARHDTHIEDGAFVGSNAVMVAPVKVGKGALVGAGSLVKSDVEEGELVVPVADLSRVAKGASKVRDKKSAAAAKRASGVPSDRC